MSFQSDLLYHLLHYLFIYPFLSIALSEMLTYLTQRISRSRWTIRSHWQGNAWAESTDDAQETNRRADQVSSYGMLTFINGVLKFAWSILTVILNKFTDKVITLLQRDNTVLESDNQVMSIGPSGDGRNENEESEERPAVPSPEACVRRLRSGRVYDVTQVLDSPSVESRPAADENSQSRRSPASNNSASGRMQNLENWFGDSYRSRQEERLPDYILKYGRSSSLLSSLSSPLSLVNMRTDETS